ncbi:Clan MG, family M24, aminopeptidase P-like metallopeptidase [Trichomonas vaginalis G3]|uniref:FACT complex subunit n=1 Tax=Trichomonas vaginalis (strain ATCC PRA-98 / G3) TaxID=412133 RepID=A2E2S0_TRIV3|nr:Clan MG, family M24, aminopeptidase P-like metallopeptidase [Trichomonas vaginalis G3]EAY13098.1 Clan MG, family M24, aminopeptidase P-like metallopeptidase [Trichomonas vaginalis G3]KAI5548287.1 Clan MG, family M24, aminopeptidase P-like metallopeptidase [Trichomonas vaginalis G3]|eukprot:XP_001325321.1 Clan MG, familly M24, aminopeptidase P-like metallopeptidase [Trichomonas vaginalis G3]
MNDIKNIEQRLEIFRKAIFTEESSDFKGVVLATSTEKPNLYSVDDAIFRWIYGVFVTNSYLIITPDKLVTLCKDDKASDAIAAARTPEKVIIDQLKGSIADQVKIYANGRLFGSENAIADSDLSSLSLTDKTYDLEGVLIVHLDVELARIRNAARVADGALTKVFKLQMEQIIESSDTISLKSLSNDTRKDLNNPSKVNPKLNPSDVEPAFRPAIRCGSNFDIDFPPTIGEGNLTTDFVNATIGINFKSYCACVGRTYIINGSDDVKRAYKSLVKAKQDAFEQCKAGNTLGAIYRAFVKGLDEQYQQYVPHSIGGFCGTYAISRRHLITDDSEEKIPNNCSIILALGLKGVKIGDQPPFSLSLVDTVQIADGEDGVKFATNAKDRYKLISYKLSNEDQDSILQEMLNDQRPMYERTRNKTGSGTKKDEEDPEMLAYFESIKNQRKSTSSSTSSKNKDDDSDNTQYTSFDNMSDLTTRGVTTIEIIKPRWTVLLPMYGRLVPFHINTIKSAKASTSTDSTESKLDINFNIPKATDSETFKYFIKELTFSQKGNQMFDQIAKDINSMRSHFTKLLKRKQEEKTLYKGEDLIPLQAGPGKNIPRISGHVHLRPALNGNKTVGTIEAHVNGFRFRSTTHERLDVMYKNIELAIYLPATEDNEMMTLIHFYLKKPITTGKQSSQHITFYKPTGDTSVDVSKQGNSMTDQAELAEEERDRKIRKKINKEFKYFKDLLEDKELGLDNPPKLVVPHKQLGFYGVCSKEMSVIYLLPNAIASVVNSPPFVLMMDRVDIVVFERETLSVTNIDISFILKNLTQEVVQISHVSVTDAKNIKQWLGVLQIPFFSSKNNITWKDVIPNILKKGRAYFESEIGGWKGFFNDEEEEVDSEVEDKTWKDDDDDEGFDGGDDDDDEEFDAAPSDEDEDEDEMPAEDSEDEGKDWRQLDEEAKAADERAKAKRERKKEHHHHHHH